MADLNEEALKTAIESLPGGPEKHIATRVDVRNEDSVNDWIEKTVQRFGKLDGAVNMAGVLGPSVPTTELSREQLEFVFSVNVFGVFNCMKAQLKVMKRGSIVSKYLDLVMCDLFKGCQTDNLTLRYPRLVLLVRSPCQIALHIAPARLPSLLSRNQLPKKTEMSVSTVLLQVSGEYF